MNTDNKNPLYHDFIEKKGMLGDYYPYDGVPPKYKLRMETELEDSILYYKADSPKYDKEICEKNYDPIYEGIITYKNIQYIIVLPKTLRELSRESVFLNVDLLDELPDIIKNAAKIAFLRTKENQDKALIIFKICNEKITMAYGESYRELEEDEKKALAHYAKEKSLGFDENCLDMKKYFGSIEQILENNGIIL